MGEAGFPLSVLVIGNYSGSADVDLSNLKRHLVFEVTTRPSVSHTITFPSHKVQYGDLVDAKMGEKKKNPHWSHIYTPEYRRGLGPVSNHSGVRFLYTVT